MNKESNKTGIFTVGATHLLHDIYSSFLSPLLPLLMEKHQLTKTMCGLLSAAGRFPSAFNAFVGILADKWNLKILISLTPAVTAIAMSCLGLADSFFTLLVLLTIMGISNAFYHIPAPILAKDLSGQRIGFAMSIFMLGGQLARTIGPATILAAVTFWGLEGSWKIMIPGIILSIISYFLLKPYEIHAHKIRKKKQTTRVHALKEHFPILLCVGSTIFFTSMLKASISTFLPIYMTESGESKLYAGSTLIIIQFSGAVGSLILGTISDKIGRRKILLITSTLSPILMLIFLNTETELIRITLLTLMGFCILAGTPLFLAVVNECRSCHPGLLNGVFQTCNFSISVLTLPILGFLSDWLGMQTAYYIAAVTAFVTLPFIYNLKPSTKES